MSQLVPAINLPIESIESQFANIGLIVGFSGRRDSIVKKIGAAERFVPGDMIFVDKVELAMATLERLKTIGLPAVVVTSSKLAETMKGVEGLNLLMVQSVPFAHALFKQKWSARNISRSGWTGIHPSAVIHPSARVNAGATIEPQVVIGAEVQIGCGVRIMAGTIVENDVWIGENTVLHPRVTIGYGSIIGRDVVIEAGTVIGSAGFGYAQDANRKSHVIPQTGIVVLEDRVRIGAGCCIDRAAYHVTKIGAGTKIDNLCHIAHGVEIGEDCLLTAMLCVAGSTKIGNRVMTSGQTGILDHITVCDDAVFVHRAGVTKDIEVPGAYAGLPTQPLADYMKNSAVLRNATELRKRLTDLERKVSK